VEGEGFSLEQAELIELNVIVTRVILLQINHISISVGEEFVEEKINKLTIFFRKH